MAVTLTPSYVTTNNKNKILVSIVLGYQARFVYNHSARSRVASVLAGSLSPVWQATRNISFCRDRLAVSIFELKTIQPQFRLVSYAVRKFKSFFL